MRKVGSEMPTNETVRNSFDNQASRFNPVYTPIGMPTSRAKIADMIDSSSVAGKRSNIISATGRLNW